MMQTHNTLQDAYDSPVGDTVKQIYSKGITRKLRNTQRKQKKSEEYTKETQNQAKRCQKAAEGAIKLDSERSFTTINDSLHFRTSGK